MEFRSVLRRSRPSLVVSLFLAALLGTPAVPAVAASPSPNAPASTSVDSAGLVELSAVELSAIELSAIELSAVEVSAIEAGAVRAAGPVAAVLPTAAAPAVFPTTGPVVAAIFVVLVLSLLGGPAVRSRITRLTSVGGRAVAGPRAPPATA